MLNVKVIARRRFDAACRARPFYLNYTQIQQNSKYFCFNINTSILGKLVLFLIIQLKKPNFIFHGLNFFL